MSLTRPIWPGYTSIHLYPYFVNLPVNFNGLTYDQWINRFKDEMRNLGLPNDNGEWHYVGGGQFRFVHETTAAIFKLRFK